MGRVLCLVSATCFGGMAIFGKLAYQAGVTPAALVLLRFWLAASLMSLLVALRPSLRLNRGPGPAAAGGAVGRQRVWLTAFGLGAIGYATQASCYFAALERLDAPQVSLVLYTYPALVTLGAALLGRERLTRCRVGALILASAGTILVLIGSGGKGFDPTGVAFAFGGALTYTAYILVADTILDALPPVVLTTVVMVGAAVTLSLRAAVTGGVAMDFGAAGWLWIGAIVVISTMAAMLTFFAGMQRTGPATASILSTFEPVVSVTLAGLVLGQLLTPVQMVGAVLVLAAAILVHRRDATAPDPAATDTSIAPRKDPQQDCAATESA